MNKLGNCYSYETVLKEETARVELSQELSQRKNPLPLKPYQPGKHVLTYFWWDNFGCKKENLKGSIHTTHGIAFQEKSEHWTSLRSLHSVTPSGKKSLKVTTHNLPLVVHILEHMKKFKKRGFLFVEITLVYDNHMMDPGNKFLWGTRRLQEIIFDFLCVLSVFISSFSEEANICLFSILGPHEIALSQTTRVYVILVCII